MLCSRCYGPRETESRRYCNACHATYMRDWRKTHPPTRVQVNRHRTRYVAWLYAKRNGIKFDTCADCGPALKIEMHHPDYLVPHEIIPLCPGCHAKRHRTRRGKDLDGLQNLKELRRGRLAEGLTIKVTPAEVAAAYLEALKTA